VRYIAADLSEEMLARAKRRAARRRLSQIELLTADMNELPLDDNFADLCLSYSGLHAVPDPERALRELVRCLKPSGELIGTAFVRDRDSSSSPDVSALAALDVGERASLRLSPSLDLGRDGIGCSRTQGSDVSAKRPQR